MLTYDGFDDDDDDDDCYATYIVIISHLLAPI